jgi:RimJ/RimL family protein N-acetyltransferase
MTSYLGPSSREADLPAQRRLVRPLLAPSDPADAMTAYYALQHDPRRVALTLHYSPSGQVDGFVAVCQTGRDLFVPLVLVRAPPSAVSDLLRQALYPGRPYTIVTKPELRDQVVAYLTPEWERIGLIYMLDASAYRPVINVMVQPGDGPFRYEIRVDERVVAAAGVNWQTTRLAEMYVYTECDFRGRGWGRAVGARCIQALLEAHLLPLYTAAEDNVASQRLAEALGFHDSGAREFECYGQLRTREAR